MHQIERLFLSGETFTFLSILRLIKIQNGVATFFDHQVMRFNSNCVKQ